MKPDWDQLMDAFADSETALVADVDCTTEGKELCTAQGVKGYVSPIDWFGRKSMLLRLWLSEIRAASWRYRVVLCCLMELCARIALIATI